MAAVGDIACDASDLDFNGGEGTFFRCRQAHVARLIPGAARFLALGDLQYEKGTAAQFAGSYDRFFGPFKSITKPIPGNHEYDDPAGGAAGYFGYFGVPPYYSFDVGGWHVVALNSNCDYVSCDAGSPQSWTKTGTASVKSRGLPRSGRRCESGGPICC